MALAAARSGLRRYPRHIAASLRTGDAPASALASRFAWGDGDALGALWLGHATTLLRVGRLTVLTDPVFSHRIGLALGKRTLGLARRAALPPLELPPADVILISHAHFDHLDKPTLRRLAHPATTVITARGTGRLIPAGFGRVLELGWDGALEVDGVEVRALRPRHWGARTAWDRHRGYNSYLLEHAGQRVLYAGDTAQTNTFDHLRPTLAIFGIGAYEPWIHAHATPEQVWSMFTGSGGRYLMPVHHSTFELGDEHPDEPMARLLASAGDHAERIVCRAPGEAWRLPGAE